MSFSRRFENFQLKLSFKLKVERFLLYKIQSKLRLRAPLLSDQFSKIPNVSKSLYLEATTSCKRRWPLLELKFWNFPVYNFSLATTWKVWSENWIIRCCNIIVFLASTRNENFSMRLFEIDSYLNKQRIGIDAWVKYRQLPRSPSPRACFSHKPMQRHFYRLVYF